MNGAAKTGSITVEKDNNMLINRKINPLLEALQYYNRRVNGTSVSDTMIRLENAYPERVHEIHSTVAPILDLDNLLSAELVPDMDRLNFFFKQVEGVNGADSIGTSAASIIFFEEAYKNFDAADELFEHMSKFSRGDTLKTPHRIRQLHNHPAQSGAFVGGILGFYRVLPFPR